MGLAVSGVHGFRLEGFFGFGVFLACIPTRLRNEIKLLSGCGFVEADVTLMVLGRARAWGEGLAWGLIRVFGL